MYRNGVLLVAGVDYSFVYDNNNHIIRLIAASGIWQNGNVYDIYINNGTQFDPNQNGGSPATGITGIADLAGNSLQADSPTGYTNFRYHARGFLQRSAGGRDSHAGAADD